MLPRAGGGRIGGCLLALLLPLLGACSGDAPAPGISGPYCATPDEDRPPEGWIEWHPGDLVVALPPLFEAVPEPVESYPHGGYQWRDGARKFELVHGSWAPASLEAVASRWCLGKIGETRVIFFEEDGEEARVFAWYLTGTASTEPLIRASSDRREDRALLWQIVRRQRPFAGGGSRD